MIYSPNFSSIALFIFYSSFKIFKSLFFSLLVKLPQSRQKIIVKKNENLNQIIPCELTFLKLESEGYPVEFEVTTNTGETLYKWAERKAKKDALRMITLLSVRIDDFFSAGWHISIPNGDLIFLHNTFDGKDYYDIGFGDSKTKAKKDAPSRFLDRSKLFNWIKEKYGDTPI